MNTASLLIPIVAFGFFMVFLFGYRLSRVKKPYPGLIFNFHKLTALVLLVYLILTTIQIHRIHPLNLFQLATVIISGLCFVLTMVSGGLVSVEKSMPAFVKKVHKVLPYLTLLLIAATYYSLYFF